MSPLTEPGALVYCEGAFRSTNGKTAHGLVRFTTRYRVLSVIDSSCAGRDAGDVLDGIHRSIPIHASVADAIQHARSVGRAATHLVIGLAPDGGGLSPRARADVLVAVTLGLNVDAALHDFLADDPDIAAAAARRGVTLRDFRKPPPREQRHFFSGKINEVGAFKVAVLGTDSAVGKRTTAWMLTQALEREGISAEMVGTGQTAFLQGARYGLLLDVTTNDFLSGEIEHAVWSAWTDRHPDVIVVEGQGSLLNPAYPSGYELLAAGRPDAVILQHAPARVDYDGFPGYPIQPLGYQIRAVEIISGKPVVAVAINHEGLSTDEIPAMCRAITRVTGVPACDVLTDGPAQLVEVVRRRLASRAPSKPGDV